jgi:hypothetical protein
VVDAARDHDLSLHVHHLPQQCRHQDSSLVVHLQQLAVVDPFDQLQDSRFHRRLVQQSLLDTLPHRKGVDSELVREEGAGIDFATKVHLELLAQPCRELEPPLGVDGGRESSSETLHSAPFPFRSEPSIDDLSHIRPFWTTSDHSMMICHGLHVKVLDVK